jgi:hypothetical protein
MHGRNLFQAPALPANLRAAAPALRDMGQEGPASCLGPSPYHLQTVPVVRRPFATHRACPALAGQRMKRSQTAALFFLEPCYLRIGGKDCDVPSCRGRRNFPSQVFRRSPIQPSLYRPFPRNPRIR